MVRWFPGLVRLVGVCGVWSLTAGQGVAIATSSSDAQEPDATLFLDLLVNEVQARSIVRVDYRDGHYFVDAEDLRAVGVRLDPGMSGAVAVDALAGVTVVYERYAQQLRLEVPLEWLPEHMLLGNARTEATPPAATSLGFVFNYHLLATSAGPTHLQASMVTEERLFDRWGTLANTGVWRRTVKGPRPFAGNPYLRHTTTWTFSDERELNTYTAGDLITAALPWTSAVRLGGFSFARNFRLRPDLITHPLPEFAGQAAVPTTVDVLINGRPTLTSTVAPGPFTITDLPTVNGAGTATIVTTDALGQRVATTVPFYVANTLLQKGLVDYSVSAGMIRRQFGSASWEYGRAAASGVLRYGVSNAITLEGHVEGGRDLVLGGIGGRVRLGVLGVVNGSVSTSHLGVARGLQVGYTYAATRFSISLQHMERTATFVDLGSYDSRARLGAARAMLTNDHAAAALALGRRGGSLSGGYIFARHSDGTTSRFGTLSYTRAFIGRSTMYVTGTHDLVEASGVSVKAQVVVPFGNRAGTVSVSSERTRTGDQAARLTYSRNVAPRGGIGWNVGTVETREGTSHQADLTWRTNWVEASAGAYQNGASRTQWTSLAGSAIVMGGSAFPANRVSDAFALIDTGGHADVPVYFENQLVGSTNRRGKLLVPWVTAYYPASYRISPLSLDADLQVPATERRVAVRYNSGAVVSFPIDPVRAAVMTLVDAAGEPLAVGTKVVHVESGQIQIVGWEGLLYLEGVRTSNRLIVTAVDGHVCRVGFELENLPRGVTRLGRLACR